VTIEIYYLFSSFLFFFASLGWDDDGLCSFSNVICCYREKSVCCFLFSTVPVLGAALSASPLKQEGQEIPCQLSSHGKWCRNDPTTIANFFRCQSYPTIFEHSGLFLALLISEYPYQQLDDIGFNWEPRKHTFVSFEDSFCRSMSGLRPLMNCYVCLCKS
jgi:hypothetical protein